MDNTHKGLPYIGVTDFATHAQVLEAVECIPARVDRRLHVGVMMSYETLHGIPTETGWEKIWPDEAGLRKIFQPHQKFSMYFIMLIMVNPLAQLVRTWW